jgi:GT2 family glycosyltransferase
VRAPEGNWREDSDPVPSVSVVVCTYTERRWDDLVASVRSASTQAVPPLEVIVVTDHQPALLERVRRELPEAVAVANEERPGLSGARNSGVRAARGEVVAFLDDDAVAAPGWLAHLLGPYADPAVFGVGGSIDPRFPGNRPRSLPAEFDWVVGCTYRGLPTSRAPVRNLIGANMSFRRSVFERIGGFHNDIGRIGSRPLGCEETEFCIRARQAGAGELVLEPAARVRHRVPSERTTWRYFGARCWAEGLSKAIVARRAGRADGLASERSYTLRTLPRGIAAGLADAALRRDPSGLLRASAIAAGLAITSAGYVFGTARARAARP